MSGYKPPKDRSIEELLASLTEKRGRMPGNEEQQRMEQAQAQGYGKPAKAADSSQYGSKPMTNNPSAGYSFGGSPVNTGVAQSATPYTFGSGGAPTQAGQSIGLGQPSGAAPMQYPGAQPQSPMMTPGGAAGAAGGSVGPFRGNVNAGVAMPFMNPNAQLNPGGGLPRGITGNGIVGAGGLAGPLQGPSGGGLGGLIGGIGDGIGDLAGGVGRGVGGIVRGAGNRMKDNAQDAWKRLTGIFGGDE